jgi:hypothetical protein
METTSQSDEQHQQRDGEMIYPDPRPHQLVERPRDDAEDEDEDEAAAPASAVAVGAEGDFPSSVDEGMRTMRKRQDEQSHLISRMKSRIRALEDDVRWLVGLVDPTRRAAMAAATASTTSAGTTRDDDDDDDGVDRDPAEVETSCAAVVASSSIVGATMSTINTTVATTDDDIDAIIESLVKRGLWPLRRRYCQGFTNDVDLIRVRRHVGDRHDHVPVRIPKINKNECTVAVADGGIGGGDRYGLGNREGRLICRLCSGKTMNRNTSWMCPTCVVPLCVDASSGGGGGGDANSSCHSRWHSTSDLVELNAMLNSSLRERRTSRKRLRTNDDDAVAMQRDRCWGAFPVAEEDREEEDAMVAPTCAPSPANKVKEVVEDEPPSEMHVAASDVNITRIV